jgi:hypothetical protein
MLAKNVGRLVMGNLSPITLYLAKLCRDVPPERLYDKKEQGGLYKQIWYHT